jgi:hypothetical protein
MLEYFHELCVVKLTPLRFHFKVLDWVKLVTTSPILKRPYRRQPGK